MRWDSNVEIGEYTSTLCQLAEQDRNVTQCNVKIDTEVAGLKTMLESHKLDSIKYLAGNISELFVPSAFQMRTTDHIC